VTSLPPPTGPPAVGGPRPDHWTEELRRRELDRRDRRPVRRVVWAGVVAAVGAAIVVAAVAVSLLGSVDGPTGRVARDLPPPPTTTPAPASTVRPDELVGVEEVWLLDRQDGSFDWGVIVVTPPGTERRSGVEVTVRLVTAGGEVVHTATDVLDGVSATSPGALGGRVEGLDGVPARIEFDVSVGRPADDASLGELLDVRAVEHGDGVLAGRVRSVATDDLTDLRLVLVWRSDGRSEIAGEVVPEGEVIATVVRDVGRIRPDVEARFEVELDPVVPDREPDDVYWAHRSGDG
jgi:hypothetical protein